MARRRPPVGTSWGDLLLALGITAGFLLWARARDSSSGPIEVEDVSPVVWGPKPRGAYDVVVRRASSFGETWYTWTATRRSDGETFASGIERFTGIDQALEDFDAWATAQLEQAGSSFKPQTLGSPPT